MAKGDHDRGERRIDEQMKQSQSYLTQLQQQLGNQYGGLSNMYMGGFPQQGQIYGWGTTVPHYSEYGPIYSGNGTDTPVGGNDRVGYGMGLPERAVGRGQSIGAQNNYEQQFRELFGNSNTLTPEQLVAKEREIQAMGGRILGPNAKGQRTKVEFGGQVYDVIGGAGAGHNRLQFMADGPGRNSSFGGGNNLFGMPGGVAGMNLGDYGDIQGAYKGLFGDMSGRYGNLLNQWQGFANTGGYSEGDKANIRARAVSPIRSIYSSARRELDRGRALQGGYAPGLATAYGRLAREQGQLASDATTNAEAAIAEMVQRGKLAGLGGMTSGLGNMGSTLGGLLGGRTSAYGATPGLSNMFGNQMLQSMGQQLQMGGLQNQLGLGLINAQLGLSRVPGDVGGFFGGLGDFARNMSGAIYPWMGGLGSGGSSPGGGGNGPAGSMPSPYGYG